MRSKIACAAICKKDDRCYWYDYQGGICKIQGKPAMNTQIAKNVYKSKSPNLPIFKVELDGTMKVDIFQHLGSKLHQKRPLISILPKIEKSK